MAVTHPEPGLAVEGLDGFSHRYAEVNGTRIHYVIGGSGPAVVLVHGFPFTWALWREVMPLLAARGYTVLAPDLRGMGDSDPAASDTFAKTNVAEDIRQIVLSLGLGPINLVGMDVGGMVVYAYASRHPDEVRRLVLSETLIPGFGLDEMMNPSVEGGTYMFGFAGQVDLATFLTKGKEAEYLTPFYRLTSVREDAEEFGVATYLPYFTGPDGIRGGFQHYGAMIADGKANRAELTTRLPMPVLVLNGDHGYYRTQLLAGARQVAEHLETDVIAQASHAYAFDNPQATAARFGRFFAVSEVERLVVVDEIRQFMAGYAYHADHKEFDKLAQMFAPEATFTVYDPQGEQVAQMTGPKEIEHVIAGSVGDATAIHHLFSFTTEVHSPISASSVVNMADWIDGSTLKVRGYGHYRGEFAKVDGAWRIETLVQTRLRTDVL
ncbi:alpha/beta fold hydrolase [Actinoplanes sp. TBRC 11911]|uniref:alpha/beta fold hydrolase n=1 Tax=Actinoplanes sp. TBRC 11911 TaxID=2729386 RepID=UPI00145C603A|nr:alpha/beta fold hydrolase [Actinoplanes sp. TBRC 11911]NMO56913.1 alpha/beta fold hydrolase [Actinoplanes sp. TBRC 11911]